MALAAIGPRKARAGHAPALVAVVAAVMFAIQLLEALDGAARATRAFVEPVAVGVQAVFYVLRVDWRKIQFRG